MSVFRGFFNTTFRSARRAERLGDHRGAATLYAMAGATNEAVGALLVHAARATTEEERTEALREALRFLRPGDARYAEIAARLGAQLFARSKRQRHDERALLEEAATWLERGKRHADAASAHDLLGQPDEVARLLEEAGEPERLEAWLTRRARVESTARDVAARLRDHETALAIGARTDAFEAIERAAELAPADELVLRLLRAIDARRPRPDRLDLAVEGRRVIAIAASAFELGRADADVALRGTSLSRRHCRIERRDDRWWVEDLGSRNGTRIGGLSIGAPFALSTVTTLALGDDVSLRVTPTPDGALDLEVCAGLDVGTRVVAGPSPLALAPWPLVLRAQAPTLPKLEARADGGLELVKDFASTMRGTVLGLRRAAFEVLREDRYRCGATVIDVVG